MRPPPSRYALRSLLFAAVIPSRVASSVPLHAFNTISYDLIVAREFQSWVAGGNWLPALYDAAPVSAYKLTRPGPSGFVNSESEMPTRRKKHSRASASPVARAIFG